MIATSCDHESGRKVWSIIPYCFSNEGQLAHCNRRPNVGNVVEHLEGILPLDVVILDLRHVDVEYVPDTSLKERL